MNTQIHTLGLNLNTRSRAWLAQQLEQLRRLVTVTAAEVRLERQRETAPKIRAQVHLAVPGPDIHAEARDHTLEAAWLKVAAALRRQIVRRKARQQVLRKARLKHPQPGSR